MDQQQTSLTDERLKYLQAFRDGCVKDGSAALASYEKATLTLFGIGLATSVGLANELLKESIIIHLAPLLWGCWVLMVIAILVLLTTFLLSHMIFERLTALVDQQLSNPQAKVNIQPPALISTVVRLGNWLSLLLFASGLVCFLLFAANNISGDNRMTNDPKTPQTWEEIRKGDPGYAPAPATPSAPGSDAPAQTPPASNPPPNQGGNK